MAADLLYKTEAALSERGIAPEVFSDFLTKHGVDISKHAFDIHNLVEMIFTADNHTLYREDYLSFLSMYQKLGLKNNLQNELLNSLGYTYVDTHKDMRIGSRGKQPETLSASELANYVFENYPLVGEYQFSKTEKEKLLSEATNVFNKILAEESVNIDECTVLTLEMILLARFDENDSENTDDPEKQGFWKGIFTQLGLGLAAEDSSLVNKLSGKIKRKISRVFSIHKRYLEGHKESSNFKIPYTPMRLHALYPQESIYSLFNILLDYYGNELDSQFVENDFQTYKKLAKTICDKQNSTNNLSENEKVKVRSDKMMSGLCALFNDRVFYAARLCESITRKIDLLLRGTDANQIKPDESRWDELLIKWFNEKCSEKPALMTRTYHAAERIITRSENINASYTLGDGCVSISFPSIRLGEQAENAPEVTVYSGDKVVYNKPLRCYGNEVTTVRAFSIPLEELISADTTPDSIDYRVCIDFHCSMFKNYDSADTLSRSYIIFNDNGNEISTGSIKSNSVIKIAYPNGHDLLPDGAENVFSFGQAIKITSLSFLDNTSILFDGESIFRGSAARNKFTAHPSVQSISGVRVTSEGRDYALFNAPFDLIIELPDELTALHDYRVYNGDNVYSLNELCGEKRHFTLHCDTENTATYVAIKDITSGKTEYPLLYAIIKGFDFTFNDTLFLGNTQYCDAIINGITENIAVDPSSDTANFSVNGLNLTADVPIVHCELDGNDLFEGTGYIWHNDTSYQSVISVRVPNGYTASIQMDEYRMLNTSNGRDFQIGAYSPDSGEPYEEAVLLLKDSLSNVTDIKLFDMVYSEMFRTNYNGETPIKLEKGKVIWQPEHLFIGDADTAFNIELRTPDGNPIAALSASTRNTEIPCSSLINDGWVSCKISVIKDDLFSFGKKTTIFNELIPLGNEDSFRFTGKTLHLEHYRYYDCRTNQVIRRKLNEFTGYLCDISFTGDYTSPQYGMSEYPKYTAVLKFYAMKSEKYIPYRFNKDGNGMNPVSVWLLPNDTLMISPSDDEEGTLNIECDGNRISQGDGIPIDDYTYTTR